MICMPWMDKGMHGLATAAVLSRIRLWSSSLTPPPQARQRGRRIYIHIYHIIYGMCKSSCDAWDGWVSDWLSANQHLGVFSRCGVVCPQLNDAGEVGRQGKCLTRGCSIHVLILDAFVDLCQRLLELLRRAKAEPDLLVRNAATWHHFVNPVQVCSSPHRHICSRPR